MPESHMPESHVPESHMPESHIESHIMPESHMPKSNSSMSITTLPPDTHNLHHNAKTFGPATLRSHARTHDSPTRVFTMSPLFSSLLAFLAIPTCVLGQQHLLSVETVDALVEQHMLSPGVASVVHSVASFGDGHIAQAFELELNATHRGEQWATIRDPDGLWYGINYFNVTVDDGVPFCVQTTEDAGNIRDWSGYYPSHSTDRSGCTHWDNHISSAVEYPNRTTFRCFDGSDAPGTCRGIKLRVHCYSDCTIRIVLHWLTL